MLAADADARADLALEVGAEDVEGAGGEALVLVAVEARIRAEKLGDAGADVPAELLVAVAVAQVVDIGDKVVREPGGVTGVAAAGDLLTGQRVAEEFGVDFLVAVVGAKDDALSDAPGEDGVVDELGAPVEDVVAAGIIDRHVQDIHLLVVGVGDGAGAVGVGEHGVDVDVEVAAGGGDDGDGGEGLLADGVVDLGVVGDEGVELLGKRVLELDGVSEIFGVLLGVRAAPVLAQRDDALGDAANREAVGILRVGGGRGGGAGLRERNAEGVRGGGLPVVDDAADVDEGVSERGGGADRLHADAVGL